MRPIIGEVIAYAGSSAPSGFLICDGSAVSRTTYATLFSVIGTTFGTGDGSTTFNLPNLKGRTIVGYNSGDASFDAIGETGGAQTANLAHSHTQNAHTHSISGTTGDRSANQIIYAGGGSCSPDSHTHTFSFTSGAASDLGTNSQLSATQTIQNPYLTLNFIIRHKAYKLNPEFLLEII